MSIPYIHPINQKMMQSSHIPKTSDILWNNVQSTSNTNNHRNFIKSYNPTKRINSWWVSYAPKYCTPWPFKSRCLQFEKKKKPLKKILIHQAISNEIAKTKTCYIHFNTYVTMELYKLSHRLNISMREATSGLHRFKHYRGQTPPPRHSWLSQIKEVRSKARHSPSIIPEIIFFILISQVTHYAHP